MISATAAGAAALSTTPMGRGLARVEKPARLPVWPVVNGLAATALDLMGLGDAAAWVEDRFGGRVAPMMLDVVEADPFVLLVHHRHAFDAWDPIRPLFRLLLPEGFPAHPHRGFETVTATIQGGLTHRDSLGVRQVYGDGEVQWLTAAAGVLHEEMWWARPGTRDCELYQLWLNLPAERKRDPPGLSLLPNPHIIEPSDGAGASEVFLNRPRGVRDLNLGGSLGEADADAEGKRAGPNRPDVALRRLLLDKGASYQRALPSQATCILYVRKGRIDVKGEALDRHCLAYTRREGTHLKLTATDDADVLLLAAIPLKEPVAASGTWVLSSQRDLLQADMDYASGTFGRPWPHTFSDDEWRATLATTTTSRSRTDLRD